MFERHLEKITVWAIFGREKTRDNCARYAEKNKYLEEFPPFRGKQQVLPEDEILEHLEFAIQNSWQKQMVLRGFNTLERSTDDFIEFCER